MEFSFARIDRRLPIFLLAILLLIYSIIYFGRVSIQQSSGRGSATLGSERGPFRPVDKSYENNRLKRLNPIPRIPNPFYDGKDQQNRIYTDRDFVSPITMKSACDWHYGNLPQPHDITLIPLVVEKMTYSQSIFVDTTDIERFLTEVLPTISVQFVLVTGDSDKTENPDNTLKLLQSKLILHWYVQKLTILGMR
jgi:hypothetical protein